MWVLNVVCSFISCGVAREKGLLGRRFDNSIGHTIPFPRKLHQFCSVLAISYLGAKHNFEIWAFKVFFLWTLKTPLRMASRGSDLNIKMGQNTQEIHHKA